jgi:hypothetical protein
VIESNQNDEEVRVDLPRPLSARYLRIYPQNWTTKPCMQVGLYGFQIGKSLVKCMPVVHSDDRLVKRVQNVVSQAQTLNEN